MMKPVLLGVLLLVVAALGQPTDSNKNESLPKLPPQPDTNTTTAIPTTSTSTTVSPTEPTTSTAKPTTEAPNSTTTHAPPPPTNTTTTTQKPTTTASPSPITKPTSTTASPSPKPTVTPTPSGPTTTHAPPEPSKGGRHFDGMSFMAGIIMTTCVVGMSVGAYKFYKIRTDRSYRTL